MTDWDDCYINKSYGYTPEDEVSASKFERRMRYAMLAVFAAVITLGLTCIELS